MRDLVMFEDVVPKRRIGCLVPLDIIDFPAYEFYRIAPPQVLTLYVSVSLKAFSPADAERALAPVDRLVDALTERGVDILVQSGVPLPLLIGLEAHDMLLERMRRRGGKPATSSVASVVNAAEHLGIRRIVTINRWSPQMNSVLAEFFARQGVEVVAVGAESMSPAELQKVGTADGMAMAYELSRRTLDAHPEADGLYIGGGSWLVLPVVQQLEKELGIPAISNQDALLWNCLREIGFWQPRPGLTRLLAGN